MREFIQHLQNRSYAFMIIFIVGFLIGYPISEEIIELLLSSEGYKPSNVEIIILQPMEVILLQLQMGTQIGFLLLIFIFIIDIAANSHKIIKRTKIRNKYNFDWKIGRIIPIIIISLFLAMAGIIYSHEILIPMLLDYLSPGCNVFRIIFNLALKIMDNFHNWTIFFLNNRLPNTFSDNITD